MRSTRLLQAVRRRRSHYSGAPPVETPTVPRAGFPVSRRRFMQATGGVLAAGTALATERPVLAANDAPSPVQGSPLLAPFSLWAPIFVDSIDAEPATITDFNGVVGIAYVNGMVRRTNTQTGQVDVLPFLDADMRFMQGVYRGIDGRVRQGTFGFV